MSFHFRPAVRAGVPLLVGLAGGTGSGKTKSALEIATGIAGGHPFAAIDSENGRMLHYADSYDFHHGDLRAPFTPAAYTEAITAAAKHLESLSVPKPHRVIVVDSASHEQAGDGGLLDMAEDELQRMAGNDWKRREACKMASWVKPKGEHKRFMTQLLQVDAHVILCFRAEAKIEMIKGDGGRWEVVPKASTVGLDGWIPVAEKTLPFEMTVSLLFVADNPGVPKAIKLNEEHLPMVPLDRRITRDVGVALQAWASGAATTAATAASEPKPDAPPTSSVESVTTAQARKLNTQVGQLRDAGKLQTRDLYLAIARGRGVEPADLVQSIEGARDEGGDLHWGPLRETLTKQEAGGLIERLSRLEGGEQEAA